MSFSERLMFLQQLRNEVVTTGALTPSSRFLANAITSEFAKRKKLSAGVRITQKNQ